MSLKDQHVGLIQLTYPEAQDGFTHCEKALKANLHLLTSERLSDVTFVVGEERKEVRCHKIFLSSRSPVFTTMFSERWNTISPIILDDVEPETFQLFLEFLYGDVFTDSVEMTIKLLHVAHKYDVRPLIGKCEELLGQNIRIGDAVRILRIGRHYCLKNLIETAVDIFMSSFEKISHHPSFKYMNEDALIYLLTRDDLLVREIELFNIALRWAKNMRKNSEMLQNIIPLIRFPLMTAQQFASVVTPTMILHENAVIDLFSYFACEGTARDDLAKRLVFPTSPRQKVYDCYEAADPSRECREMHSSSESLCAYGDSLRIYFRSTTSEEEDGTESLALVSLLVHGSTFQPLRRFWPPGLSPGANQCVLVAVEKIDAFGDAVITFTTRCEVVLWNIVEIIVQPDIKLKAGEIFRVKVKYEDPMLIQERGLTLTMEPFQSETKLRPNPRRILRQRRGRGQ